MKTVYTFDDFKLNSGTRQLLFKNDEIAISSKAFDILQHLLKHHGEIVTKGQLLEVVWSKTFVEENNLPVHISALRRILGDERGQNQYIKTVSGKGYSFVAPVRKLPIQSTTSINKVGEIGKTNSIAVLPLDYLGKKQNIKYLAEGITQDLINTLAKSPDIKVMAYSATRNYANSKLDLHEIGFQLNVEKILCGTIREFEGKLKVNIELIDASDSSNLWGDQYSYESENISSLGNKISEELARKLKLKENKTALQEGFQTDFIDQDAYNLYLKGLHILHSFASSEDRKNSLKTALKLFKQAVRISPQFAEAYSAIGRIHFFQYNNDFISKEEAHSLSQSAFQQAINCDPELSDTYVLEGMIKMFYEFDFVEAHGSFNKAVSLNPNEAYAYHMLSLLYCILGKFEESISTQEKAIQLDPTSASYNCGLINRFYYNQNFNQAIIHAEETLELNERSVNAHFILALSNALVGIFDKALAAIRKAQEIYPADEFLLTESYILARSGSKEEAIQIFDKIIGQNELPVKNVSTVASIYSAIGQEEKALDILEKAAEIDYIIIFLLKFDPRLKVLDKHPRFHSAIEKISKVGNFPNS